MDEHVCCNKHCNFSDWLWVEYCFSQRIVQILLVQFNKTCRMNVKILLFLWIGHFSFPLSYPSRYIVVDIFMFLLSTRVVHNLWILWNLIYLVTSMFVCIYDCSASSIFIRRLKFVSVTMGNVTGRDIQGLLLIVTLNRNYWLQIGEKINNHLTLAERPTLLEKVRLLDEGNYVNKLVSF